MKIILVTILVTNVIALCMSASIIGKFVQVAMQVNPLQLQIPNCKHNRTFFLINLFLFLHMLFRYNEWNECDLVHNILIPILFFNRSERKGLE